jgi:hypothetical protein
MWRVVKNYQYMPKLRTMPEERISRLHRGGSPKSRIFYSTLNLQGFINITLGLSCPVHPAVRNMDPVHPLTRPFLSSLIYGNMGYRRSVRLRFSECNLIRIYHFYDFATCFTQRIYVYFTTVKILILQPVQTIMARSGLGMKLVTHVPQF